MKRGLFLFLIITVLGCHDRKLTDHFVVVGFLHWYSSTYKDWVVYRVFSVEKVYYKILNYTFHHKSCHWLASINKQASGVIIDVARDTIQILGKWNFDLYQFILSKWHLLCHLTQLLMLNDIHFQIGRSLMHNRMKTF